MTLVVGLHVGTHVIVAADTRVSYYIDDLFGYASPQQDTYPERARAWLARRRLDDMEAVGRLG